MNDEVVDAAEVAEVAGVAPSRSPRPRFRLRRPPWWLVGLSLVGIVAIGALVTYQAPATLGVRAGDIAPAVAAVQARLGAGQRFTEINATPEGVNLFVVQPDGQERAWFYAKGKLGEPGAAAPLQAKAYALDGIDVALAPKVARAVLDRLPGAHLTGFALVDQQGRVIWSARAVSSRGGTIEAYFTTDGQPLGGALN